VHEQARRSQVGDVRTYPGKWHDLIGGDAHRDRHFLLCRDDDGGPGGYAIAVIVDHLMACTGAAYRSLWAYLADLDLTDRVVASGRPEREPLRWALADSRQLVVTGVHDHLWVRLVDLPAALSGRRYAAEGSLVLDVADPFCPWNEGRWLLESGPDGAGCWPAGHSAGASLRLDAAALGTLFLGGTSVAHLARAGRIEADSASLRRAQQMFGAGARPVVLHRVLSSDVTGPQGTRHPRRDSDSGLIAGAASLRAGNHDPVAEIEFIQREKVPPLAPGRLDPLADRTATASSFLNASRRAGGQRGRNGLPA
jgi:hypothetical protein